MAPGHPAFAKASAGVSPPKLPQGAKEGYRDNNTTRINEGFLRP